MHRSPVKNIEAGHVVTVNGIDYFVTNVCEVSFTYPYNQPDAIALQAVKVEDYMGSDGLFSYPTNLPNEDREKLIFDINAVAYYG